MNFKEYIRTLEDFLFYNTSFFDLTYYAHKFKPIEVYNTSLKFLTEEKIFIVYEYMLKYNENFLSFILNNIEKAHITLKYSNLFSSVNFAPNKGINHNNILDVLNLLTNSINLSLKTNNYENYLILISELNKFETKFKLKIQNHRYFYLNNNKLNKYYY